MLAIVIRSKERPLSMQRVERGQGHCEFDKENDKKSANKRQQLTRFVPFSKSYLHDVVGILYITQLCLMMMLVAKNALWTAACPVA